MAFKMKGSPYGEKRSGELDMKPRMSANFDKSGMKNADGSNVKPGAPGFFGNLLKGKGALGLLNPMGAIMSRMKKKKAAAAEKPVAPTDAGTPGPPPVDQAAAAAAAAPTAGAAPVDPNAISSNPAAGGVDPNAVVDPNAAPMQMRYKDSPAKTHVEDHEPYDRMQGFAEKDYDKNIADERKADADAYDKGEAEDKAARAAHEKRKAAKKSGAPMKASPAKGKMWDAIKKGKFKEAGKVLKKEGKAVKAALFAKGGYQKSKGFFRHKDERFERADPKGAYWDEKKRQSDAAKLKSQGRAYKKQ